MRRKQSLLFGILGLVLLMVGLQADLSTADGFRSQYWVNQKLNGGSEIKIFNPSTMEMFVFYFETGGGSCGGRVIGAGEGSWEDPLCCAHSEAYQEVIAVPTEGRLAGAINATVGVEVWRGTRPVYFTPLAANRFVSRSLALRNCACEELANFGLPKNLLRNFHIACP